jgi:hypothetical protein
MKLLFLDIEVALQVGYFYDQWNTNIPAHKIKHRGFMICAAWKWLGNDKIHTVSILDDEKRFKKNHRDDYIVAKKLSEQINEADAICAYNGDNFDVRELNASLVLHGLPPLRQVVQIDPYKIAKKHFRFKGGNSLRNLCDLFDVKEKKLHVDDDIWIGAADGNIKDIKTVVSRCKSDIPTMIAVYDKLKPYAPAKIDYNHFIPEADVCPSCGHPEFKRDGCKYSAAGKRQQFRCRKCNHVWISRNLMKVVHA